MTEAENSFCPAIWPFRCEETGNVILRPLCESDADECIRIVNASQDFLRPWVDPPKNDAAFRTLLENAERPDFLALVIGLESEGCMVGSINLSQIVLGNFCSAYLGFWIAKSFSGRGLMTIGLQGALRVAFDQLGLHRLEANIQPANIQSKKLVKRLGFQREGFSPGYLRIDGEWRDHERWAIRVEDLPSKLPDPNAES